MPMNNQRYARRVVRFFCAGLAISAPACSVHKLDLRHVDWVVERNEAGGVISAQVPRLDDLADAGAYFAPKGASGWFGPSGLVEGESDSDMMVLRFPCSNAVTHLVDAMMEADSFVLVFRKNAQFFSWDVAVADVDVVAVKRAIRSVYGK